MLKIDKKNTNTRERQLRIAFRGYGVAIQVISASALMVVFPLLGLWLDRKIGTGLLFAGIGLAIGFYATISQLIHISKTETERLNKENKESEDAEDTSDDSL